MNTSSLELGLVRCQSIACAVLGLLVFIGTANSAEKTNLPAATHSATNAPAKQAPIEIPVSQFVIATTTAEGRNPFFPDSLMTMRANVNTTTNAAGKVPSVALDLKGISGRFALINNRTFEAGEEGDVTSGRSKVHVHCIKIREDSVTIEADGTRMELKLRPGL